MSSDVLADRVALVTGASSGIGRATTQRLLACGARVVACARRPDLLEQLTEYTAAGRSLHTITGDATQPETIERMFSAAIAEFGSPVDLVVANAGRGLAGSVLTSNTDEWAQMFELNIVGTLRLMRVAAQRLLERDVGRLTGTPRDIVVIGSVVGRHVSAFSSVYSASKAAVASAVEGLRREVGGKGVRVSLVEPAFVVSGFQRVAGYEPEWFQGIDANLGPLLQPDDVARAVCFIVEQPPHVHVNDIVIRPVRQDYP